MEISHHKTLNQQNTFLKKLQPLFTTLSISRRQCVWWCTQRRDRPTLYFRRPSRAPVGMPLEGAASSVTSRSTTVRARCARVKASASRLPVGVAPLFTFRVRRSAAALPLLHPRGSLVLLVHLVYTSVDLALRAFLSATSSQPAWLYYIVPFFPPIERPLNFR